MFTVHNIVRQVCVARLHCRWFATKLTSSASWRKFILQTVYNIVRQVGRVGKLGVYHTLDVTHKLESRVLVLQVGYIYTMNIGSQLRHCLYIEHWFAT